MLYRFKGITLLGFLATLFLTATQSKAYEVTDKLSIGTILVGTYQYQVLGDSVPDYDETGRGALPLQVEISYMPLEQSEFFIKLGFAAGNGLNGGLSPFYLAPWAATLEDDVININGRNRDYLLTAWYKHSFKLQDGQLLALTGGIIDATDYLDENAYSNDEYTQFMNEALVNGHQGFLPSYDIGVALEWEYNQFGVKSVVMNVGKNDYGKNYNYYGVQLSYLVQSALGVGNYRAVLTSTSDDFLNPDGTSEESLNSFLLSFDQELGDFFGVWLRFGWADDDAAIEWKKLYSGGIDITGRKWHRLNDNIGIGYAYLEGGNMGIDNSKVFETYYRYEINEYLGSTADIQYMKDRIALGGSTTGWIFGLRLTAEM